MAKATTFEAENQSQTFDIDIAQSAHTFAYALVSGKNPEHLPDETIKLIVVKSFALATAFAAYNKSKK